MTAEPDLKVSKRSQGVCQQRRVGEAKRVCFPFVGDSLGGSHLSALMLARGIEDRGYAPLIVLMRGDGPLGRHLERERISFEVMGRARVVARTSIPGQLQQMIGFAPALAAYLRRRAVGLVHSNDLRMHITWGPACRLAGCRFVWHQRTANDSRRNALYARLADAVVTISEHCRRCLPPAMRRRAVVVHNPFDTEAPSPDRAAARARLLAEMPCRGTGARSVVGFVGNLTEQKRPFVFLEAAKQICDGFGDRVAFPMFGDLRPGMTERVRAHIGALGLTEHCFLMGPRYPIEPWMAACDVILAPGVNEGFGRCLVEAALTGTPVVASDDGGHREAVHDGKTGYLVRPGAPEEFAARTLSLLKNPSMGAAAAAAGRRYAEQHFSLETHVAEIMALYGRLLRDAA